jgi:hypothetical protein
MIFGITNLIILAYKQELDVAKSIQMDHLLLLVEIKTVKVIGHTLIPTLLCKYILI